MWPFRKKSLQERIGELEDQLAGLRAQWMIHNGIKWSEGHSPFWHIEQLAKIRSALAEKESKLKRLRRELEPWRFDPITEMLVQGPEPKPEAKANADRT